MLTSEARLERRPRMSNAARGWAVVPDWIVDYIAGTCPPGAKCEYVVDKESGETKPDCWNCWKQWFEVNAAGEQEG